MKIKFALSAFLVIFAGLASARPLVKENVDQNAKWLLHIDLDQLRASKLGQFLIQEVILKKAEAAKDQANNALTNLDVVKIIGQLHSLTAYGTGFDMGKECNGVLLLDVEPETRKILEGFVAGLQLNETESFKKTDEDGHVLYSFQNEVFAAPLDNGPILFSKSKDRIKQAAAVIAGKSKNLRHSKAFTDFPPVADSFIFLAVAEGFHDHLPIPPQAKVLNKADGARIVLRERGDNVLVNIALKAVDSEILKEMQQVAEGSVALVSLSQSENKDLQQLVQSIKVTSSDKMLSVAASYPVDALITHAREAMAEKQSHHQKRKHRAAEKPEQSSPDAQ